MAYSSRPRRYGTTYRAVPPVWLACTFHGPTDQWAWCLSDHLDLCTMSLRYRSSFLRPPGHEIAVHGRVSSTVGMYGPHSLIVVYPGYMTGLLYRIACLYFVQFVPRPICFSVVFFLADLFTYLRPSKLARKLFPVLLELWFCLLIRGLFSVHSHRIWHSTEAVSTSKSRLAPPASLRPLSLIQEWFEISSS